MTLRVKLRLVALVGAGLAAIGFTQVASTNPGPLQTGQVLAAIGNGKVKQFSQSGTLIDTLDTTTGSTFTAGMCFDSANNLYVTLFNHPNGMSVLDNTGALLNASFGTGYNADPESCSVNMSNQIYVGQADGTGDVLKFNTAGNLLASYDVAREDRGSDWVDLAADQCTLFYTSEGSSVKRFDVCGNTQLADFATGLSGPCYAVRIRPNGEVMVACSNQVYRLDASGGVIQSYTLPNTTGTLFALNLDPDGTSFWTGDLNNGNVYKVDIASGTILQQWNAGIETALGGLAVVGEIRAAGDQPISASGTTITATEGASFSGTVATFTDPDNAATASEYSATIDWGDSSATTTGTISGSPASFSVSGTHTYAEEGTYSVTVTITDVDNAGNAATPSSTANVADAALHAGTFTVPSSTPLGNSTNVSFSFSDDNTGAPASDFTATIDWGDSSSSSGVVTGSGGSYAATGSHTYAAAGPYTITVTVVDDGGSTTGASAATSVVAAPPVGALSAGYWKNHQAHTTSLLSITLGNYAVGTFAQATAVFKNMNCGRSSAVGCLAGQLLAAKLNVKNGAGTCIAPTIASADAFLISIGYTGPSATYTLTAAQRAHAIKLKDALDTYNNGLGC